VRTTCHFPANFFNDGTYRLRLLLVSNGRVLFDDNQILSFDLADGVRQTAWQGKWIGVVRPRFEWDAAPVPQ
jgi:lipopolysaccharide transport system ATP-binding protein